MALACEGSNNRIRLSANYLSVLLVLAFGISLVEGKTTGSIDGKVLEEVRIAVETFLENEKETPTNWSQLDAVYDFNSANVALSIGVGERRIVQDEYAVVAKPLKLPNGREILVIQRSPSKDDEGNFMRRYVWHSGGLVGASTSAEDSMPSQVREGTFPEPDPLIVARALERLAPSLAEAERNRRNDRIQQAYLIRNRALSFLFGRDVAVAPDGSITKSVKIILSAIVIGLLALASILLRRWTKRETMHQKP
jgi:hypothetical protein